MIWTTIVVAYFVGSLPTAWLVARYLDGESADLRLLGDGNMGATNISKLYGWRWGLMVGGIDLLKGYMTVSFPGALGGLFGLAPRGDELSTLAMIGGFIVTAGHIWPIWLKFRGGRGAATAVGAVGALVPVPMLFVAIPTALVLAWRQDTSLAFCFIMIGTNVVAKVFFDAPWSEVAFSAIISTLVVLTDPRLGIIKKRRAE